MDELAAVEQLKQGDIAGLEILVQLHQIRALRAVFLITQDYALAEDIVQSSFVRAFERIHQLDPDRPFGPWFLRSVVNDALKASALGARLFSLDRLAGTFDGWRSGTVLDGRLDHAIEQSVEAAETRAEIRAALAKLTVQQRTAVVARYYLQLNEAETAEIMGCARGTVKWYLHHARRQLKTLLHPL
jgi:RNA polymerase sigma-70 factor (ECF subfamily)